MLGFADILALRKGKILLVQTTTLSNVSARVNKIQALVTFEHAKQAGFLIHVHGWADHTKGGGLKVIDMTSMATLWSSIVKRGPRSKKTPRVQGEMQL